MIVVSDSTPLITLMKVKRLDILKDMFGAVLIPTAVFSEVTGNDNFREEAELIKQSDYIRVVTVEDNERVTFLQRATGLNLGESEAIIYADSEKADLLLMDEIAGRRVAQNMKLPITGSLGIIVQAFRNGYISNDEAEDILDGIRSANRHISARLLKDVLDIIRNG